MEIVCHRGANALAPENTYASARHCIDWQVDYLEIDVNTSRDGVMYVFHGPDLTRTTNGVGKIYQQDSKLLDQLDCGSWFGQAFSGERLPRLEPFLEWINGRVKIFFDVKWAPLAELQQLVHKYQMQDTAFFWFGRDKLAVEFARDMPELQIKINVFDAPDVARAVQQYGARIVEFQLTDPVDDILAACRIQRVKSMIKYDGNDPSVFRHIRATGVDMINLDHADVFRDLN